MFNFLNIFKSKSNKKTKTKVSKKPKQNNKTKTKKNVNGKSNKELCNKYKNKSVRGTPKDWAYNKCVKTNNWERCKSLPPKGYNMYKEFCE